MLSVRIRGILKYELKGKYGWSSYQPNTVDIADIISVTPSTRLFCLFDRDYPYSLNIECFNITTDITMGPAITSKGIGLAFVPHTKFSSIVTRRFKTMDEMLIEIDKIRDYQQLLDEYAINIRNALFNKE
jgi:hypothetical protein